MKTMHDIVKQNQVMFCLTCGKCSAVCPITRWEKQTYASPRLLVEKAVAGDKALVFQDRLFWSCLTCRQCTELCPSQVDFCGFIRDMRALASDEGQRGTCTHGNIVQTWSRMMTDADINQNRLGWLTEEHQVSKQSDTIYFSGCLPYYDVLFPDVDSLNIARSAVSIMNLAGIVPHVMSNERCCGHDLLWEGDVDSFKHLAKLNLDALKATGAKRIITTCPECAFTLKYDYPRYAADHGMQVLHMSQLLADLFEQNRIAIPPRDGRPPVTYQDPCRLGRHMGVWDEPRTVLENAGFDLVEMNKNKTAAVCCGTSCWTACGRVNKQIQMERLMQANATGASMVVTACVKCQIHFNCAQKDRLLQEDIGIDIRDLTTLVAEALDPNRPDESKH
jgi:heterodisulfide reductase subunit D